MTTGIITIQEFVGREVIYCVSSLIDELRKKEGCIDEEVLYDLYKGPIDYQAALYELEQDDDKPFKMLCKEDGNCYWGVKNFHGTFKVDPIHNDEKTAIYEWFEQYGSSLEDYRSEIFEHYIVTDWLASKLESLGETVVRDFMGLTIYCRPCTGQALYLDWPIQKVYQDLISK